MNNLAYLILTVLSHAVYWEGDEGGYWALDCEFKNAPTIESIPTESANCGNLCNQNDDCTNFQFENGICLLKSGVVSKGDATEIADSVCGFVPYRNVPAETGPRKPVGRPSIDFAKEKVRGVNLGSWFVLEGFIAPSVYQNAGDDVVDEYTLGKKFGSGASAYLENHWKTFVTEKDFEAIASWGLNTVRIPVGYWIIDPNPEPYATGQLKYLDAAFQWARKNKLKILIDMHGLPGSQNGWEHSGHTGPAKWDPLGMRSVKALGMLASRYANDTDVLMGIETANEIAPFQMENKNIEDSFTFYGNAHESIKAASVDISVWVSDLFSGLNRWSGRFNRLPNTVMDLHKYVIFNQYEIATSVETKIKIVQEQGDMAAKWALKNIPVVQGEWSGALTDCALFLNGYKNWYSRWETFNLGKCSEWNRPISEWTETQKADTKAFIKAQISSYEKGAGWVFWTYKTEGSDPSWNLSELVKAGLFPKFT